jgi:nicotinate-nucleotide adenylyltransferase
VSLACEDDECLSDRGAEKGSCAGPGAEKRTTADKGAEKGTAAPGAEKGACAGPGAEKHAAADRGAEKGAAAASAVEKDACVGPAAETGTCPVSGAPLGIVSETGRFDRLGFDDPKGTYRLGIMGGTFDPIHLGHLVCAEQAREHFALDGVIFVPTGKPAWKLNRPVTPAADRLAMVRIATEGNDAFDVSRLETDRPGVTYTVDTLEMLRAHYPSNVRLFFITGTDAVWQIVKWHNNKRVASLATFIAASRPGYDVEDAKRAHDESPVKFDVLYFEVPALSISSTDLRRRVHEGRSVRYLVPERVADYISEHGLYRGDAGRFIAGSASCREGC